MPKTNLMEAIRAATSDEPKTKAPKRKPGPPKRHDVDGKPILKGKQTKTADLRDADARQADAEALTATIEEWDREHEDLVARVLAEHPGLTGEALHNATMSAAIAQHAAQYANSPAPAQAQEVPLEDQPAYPTIELPVPGTERPGGHVVSHSGAVFSVLSDVFKGRSVTAGDPEDPFNLPEVRDHTYLLAGTDQEYVLLELVDGAWQEQSRGSEAGTVAFHFAFRKVQPDDLFHTVAAALPRLRPGRQALRDRAPAEVPRDPEGMVRVGDMELPMRAVSAGSAPAPGFGNLNWND